MTDAFAQFLLVVIVVIPMVFAWMLGHEAVFVVAIGALAASMQAAMHSWEAAQ